MHKHFSQNAFGSDYNVLTEYRNILKDLKYQKNYAKKKKERKSQNNFKINKFHINYKDITLITLLNRSNSPENE